MSSAGYSGTPLSKKLGIREGSRVGTRGAPDHLRNLLVPLPAGVRMESLDRVEHRAGEPRFDVVLLFADDAEGLAGEFGPLSDRLAVDGGLWVCWPKMKSAMFTGLRESDVRSTGLASGLVDNKICAVDDDWSGLRFVFRKDDRPDLRAAREGNA